jgi:hypothetical protein
VRVLKVNSDGSVTQLAGFMAYSPAFQGGVHIAVGDIDGNDDVEIITGAGPGGGPHVRVFAADGSPTAASFFAYPAAFTGGVYVGRGDVDGAGTDEIITGAGPGGGPHVRALKVNSDSSVTEEAGFFAFSPDFTGGVRVAGANVDAAGSAEIITAAGPGGGPHTRVFTGGGAPSNGGFYAYPAAFNGGVFVAGGDA